MGLTTVSAIAALVISAPLAAHAADPGEDDFLGTAGTYAIIAGDTITETNSSVVTGDVGLNPGTVQQLLPSQVSGVIHVNDPASATADADLNTAYVALANALATSTVGTTNLAGATYGPGVYSSGSTLLLDGTMTLTGGADDVFIFQASTAELTVLADSVVLLEGEVQACNVYWQVGSSATLGTNSQFVGSILAATSIAAQNGAEVTGQLLAAATNAGEVTLDGNVINAGSPCVRPADAPPGGSTGDELADTGVDTVGALSAAALLALAGIGAVVFSRRGRGALAQD
jgi:hypothetical protein